MIVRNEAAVIKRCLESVKDIIDCYSVVDTGSDDGTPEIIKSFFDSCAIYGNVHHSTWKNFGANRSESFELAKDMAEYSLLMDADTILLNKGFDKNLTADAYTVHVTSGELTMSRTLIIKNSLNWRSVGVVHEFWKSEQCFNMLPIETISIKDFADGSNAQTRIERNIELLKIGVEQEPENSRYMFYLANSFRDIHDFEKAIHWYDKRIAALGWEEETWHSLYQKGMCQIWKGADGLRIINDLLKAMNYRTWRLEPLYHLMRYLREVEMYDIAYSLGKRFGVVEYPKYDALFIEKEIYDWRFYDEMALSAYYSGHQEEAKHYFKLAAEEGVKLPVDKERTEKNLQLI